MCFKQMIKPNYLKTKHDKNFGDCWVDDDDWNLVKVIYDYE